MTDLADDISFQTLAKPYRLRAFIRARSPWFLIDLGWMAKGKDCESHGAEHVWHNIDNIRSGCCYCEVVREGQLWKK
ncbi:MAG: hypothetical protein ABL957_03710 [Parvularculaceae bacterium]